MRRTSFASVECPIARAIDQIGDPWVLLILRSALMDVRCFQDFQRRLRIPASTLTRRLDLLCEQGMLARESYRENPPRDEYVLTEKGLDLLPIVLALGVWGNKWLSPKGALMRLVDPRTGRAIDPVWVDSRSKRRLGPGRVALGAGPGASRKLRSLLAEPRLLGSASSRAKRGRA
jgi:DNA-binding HxlR family transcriptional regulator